jgi:hypothetical protein
MLDLMFCLPFHRASSSAAAASLLYIHKSNLLKKEAAGTNWYLKDGTESI